MMFSKSHFNILQDYIASGCDMDLTEEELQYYNALYALVGLHRKYGKDNAIAFLMHEPFNCNRNVASRMYDEALNLFYLNSTVENDTYRNMIFDDLQKAALVVLRCGKTSKDMEIYGNLKVQAAKIKNLDKPDPIKPKQLEDKPMKIYSLSPEAVGLEKVNRAALAAQIDSLDIPTKEKDRLKRDANVTDIDIIEMLNDTEEKVQDID